MVKDFVNAPLGAVVDLQVDGVTEAEDVADGGSTDPVTVVAGSNHSVGEVEVAGTELDDYAESIECFLNGAAEPFASGSGLSLSGIAVEADDAVLCVITNTRKLGSIKVVKDFDVNSPSSARANLLVDDVVRAANAPDGGDTGFVSVPTGTHAVSETAGTDTNLADYNSSVTCRNAAGAIVEDARRPGRARARSR